MRKMIAIIISTIMLFASISVFSAYADSANKLSDTQEFANAVTQRLVDEGILDEKSPKLTPESIKSSQAFEFYKDTESVVVFKRFGTGDMMAYDIIGDYKFNANSWFGKGETNYCGNFVYSNSKLCDLKTAVDEGLVDVVEMAAIIPNTEYIGEGEAPEYKPVKNANPMTVTVKTKTVKYSKVKKANQTVAPITVKKAQGKVIFDRVSGSKKLTLKSKGIIVVKKGTKKGTYIVKIKVTATGNSRFKNKSKTVGVIVKVK